MRKIITFLLLLTMIPLMLARVDAAHAFSFCSSLGGQQHHRDHSYYRHMPAVGFRPGYWPDYGYDPSVSGRYAAPDAGLSMQRTELTGRAPAPQPPQPPERYQPWQLPEQQQRTEQRMEWAQPDLSGQPAAPLRNLGY